MWKHSAAVNDKKARAGFAEDQKIAFFFVKSDILTKNIYII